MAEFEFSGRQGFACGWPNHCARSQRNNLARIQKVPGLNLGLDTELIGEQASEPKGRIRSCKFWADWKRFMPIAVVTWSKALTVFARSNTGILGSNPTRGMDVCVRLFCV
jgi:hypothetical protein